MIHMRELGRAAAAAIVLASLAAAPARAEIFATFTQGTPGPDDLRSVNVTTGADEALPAGVNDPAGDDQHPALSPNRRYLVFVRFNAGSRRVLMVDRTTGQIADLFNAFEAASDLPVTPAFSQDGTKVVIGRKLERRNANSPPGALQASFTQIDVTNFPNGPFPHQIVTAGGLDSTSPGRTRLSTTPFVPTRFAVGIEHDGGGPPGRVTVKQANGTTTLADPAAHLANPTISQSAGVVVYQTAPAATPFLAKLVFRPLTGIGTAPTTELPPLVNAPNKIMADANFSPDGRYLAFIRSSNPGGFPRLFVWDTQTQLLLKPDGIAAGHGTSALEVRPVFLTAAVTPDRVSFTLAQPSQVGIIVQRIVGRTRVLGRTAPKLRLVGRVPLGSFKKGRKHRVRWNGRVRGRRLARGRYLVTVRSVTGKRQVRDLAKPVRVRIR